eukprot:gnl/MRDRNA2_/MRDRNA2_70135_c0_seq1.p1 gnl/MRDRNA2_/MRDRNA2_70135_c0~~gnl/MRDRNA2_/MRDRNA2_70135_c0_seq1.p1  ORF type:complete len:115 (-),score=20.21 gnl/MRDRNA2_/MRDRNA2_70135_c0_seq1:89-433(-)
MVQGITLTILFGILLRSQAPAVHSASDSDSGNEPLPVAKHKESAELSLDAGYKEAMRSERIAKMQESADQQKKRSAVLQTSQDQNNQKRSRESQDWGSNEARETSPSIRQDAED